MNRWELDEGVIEYHDTEALKKALIGRTIVHVLGAGGGYPAELRFVLDDGSALVAHATDGGCACTNGCFSVHPEKIASGTIMNVEVREEVETWERDPDGGYINESVVPGSVTDGSSVIRIFVYTELGEAPLIRSEGGDNGYYGWGFWLNVEPAA